MIFRKQNCYNYLQFFIGNYDIAFTYNRGVNLSERNRGRMI